MVLLDLVVDEVALGGAHKEGVSAKFQALDLQEEIAKMTGC